MNPWKHCVWAAIVLFIVFIINNSSQTTRADNSPTASSFSHSSQTTSLVSLPLGTITLSGGFLSTGSSHLLALTTPTATPTSTNPALFPSPTAPYVSASVLDFPLDVGTIWVYQYTRYEGFNADEILTTTRVITETVVAVAKNPDFTSVQIQREQGPEIPLYVPPGMQDTMPEPLTSDNYWFVLVGDRIYRANQDPAVHSLTQEDALELAFPFQVGDRWEIYGSGSFERVVAAEESVYVPGGHFDKCLQFVDGWSTDQVESTFCPGIGFVESKDDHRGTPNGFHQVLIHVNVVHSRTP